MLKIILFPSLLALAIATAPPKSTQWLGSVPDSPADDHISFVVSPDGKQLSELTFDGYWHCGGHPERQVMHPKTCFSIVDGKVVGEALDPPTGGTWRFELQGDFTARSATARTFRMNITGLGCANYQREWAAAPLR